MASVGAAGGSSLCGEPIKGSYEKEMFAIQILYPKPSPSKNRRVRGRIVHLSELRLCEK